MICAVYLSEENIVIIQRSPCLRGSDDKFTDEFLIFARTIKFRSLSILAGVRIPFSIKKLFRFHFIRFDYHI